MEENILFELLKGAKDLTGQPETSIPIKLDSGEAKRSLEAAHKSRHIIQAVTVSAKQKWQQHLIQTNNYKGCISAAHKELNSVCHKIR
ncbi:hypothetical protein SERLADRAFT_432087 [Serpula lacrymans var. lacrymans S7.9]|uniref:Uncharacterized protein n=1 Tax=Serpula lacrymans var. lacrymans (strain S7.9) TaxID=578457 RepID=F8NDZ0_SERL9|nr:uncharacterized protein SERLADRAFT_432087 [Serpula lacrymans var. lacrymans S7.9]EGO30518.1 hypothetical protein SERLADRAFT_432087 [Serpula lacrymans var. lacrymans S7.9]